MTLRELVADAEMHTPVPADWPKGLDCGFVARMVLRLRPRNVLELGTGAGNSGRQIMLALPPTSRFTTVNLPNPPSGDNVGELLRPWKGDARLTQVLGDTREVRYLFPDDSIDLLFIDSGAAHEYALISREWELYESALTGLATVLCDDITVNDMPRFWDEVRYEKVITTLGGGHDGFGVFRYVRGGP